MSKEESKPDFFNTEESRNFPEDYAQENGNYINTCKYCKNHFKGNKYRFSCKLCDAGSIEYWTVLSETKKPEDNKCAHAGCWSQGEMTGYAKCMIKNYFPLKKELSELKKENEELKLKLSGKTFFDEKEVLESQLAKAKELLQKSRRAVTFDQRLASAQEIESFLKY